jgi:hypothetical protein
VLSCHRRRGVIFRRRSEADELTNADARLFERDDAAAPQRLLERPSAGRFASMMASWR